MTHDVFQKIKNLPPEGVTEPFVVARKCDGEAWYWGQYDDVNRANFAATEINGFVVINPSFDLTKLK